MFTIHLEEVVYFLGTIILRGQIQCFTVGLVCSFGFAGTEIPCDLVFCRGKLRVECPRSRDRDRAVQHAACLFRVPAGERVTCLDRRVTGGNGGLVGRDGGRHAVLAANRAAVGRGIPRHDQRDIRATIVADTIRIGIPMVAVLIVGITASRTGLCSAMLRFVVF